MYLCDSFDNIRVLWIAVNLQ